VLASPILPTLEELWSGAAKIDIYGPTGMQVKTKVQFHPDTAGTETIFSYPLGKLILPFDHKDWDTQLNKIRTNKKALEAYEAAASCSLVFRSLELGESTLHCEREFVPFRWSIRSKNSSYRLKLVQNDSTHDVTTLKAEYGQPTSFKAFALNAKGETDENGQGGLIVARGESAIAAVILPPMQMSGLSALGAVTTRIPPATDIQGFVHLCDALKIWTEAELLGGPISRGKRDASIGSLQCAVIETLCGAQWVSCEAAIQQGRKPIQSLCEMIGGTKDFVFQRSLLNTCKQAHNLNRDELSLAALELAMSRGFVVESSPKGTDSLGRIQMLMDILRSDNRSLQPLPFIDAEAATFASKYSTLVRIVRLLLFASAGNVNATASGVLVEYA
jgi:hypothetical protein